jgi:peptidoglycan/LPS O-acetylase OafA/YrhL
MRTTNTSSRYATLDGLRGIGALIVVVGHFPAMYHLQVVEHGHLAVDLFFVGSGFVIGSAYDYKFISGSLKARSYLMLRLIRLYPLYMAGLAFGVAAMALRLPVSYWGSIATALRANVFMLPSHAALPTFYPWPMITDFSYPLDFPAWSLFFELVASIGYGVFFRFLSTRTLLAIMCVSAVALGVSAYLSTLDGGPCWSSFYTGFARVGYSFPAGLLLFRHSHRDNNGNHRATVVVLLIAIGMLVAPWPAAHQHASELLLALVVPPAFVWVMTRVEPPARLAPFCIFSGAVSYGIYVLHVPLAFILQDLALRIGLRHPYGITAVTLLPGVVLLAWAVDHYYDAPLRQFLTDLVRGRRTLRPVRGAVQDASVSR